MIQSNYVETIKDQTARALWEVQNVIKAAPDALWQKPYCGMPLWKHIYHMLHSLDLWYINPRDENFTEPDIHERNLNSLDHLSQKQLSRQQMEHYLQEIAHKITDYLDTLQDCDLTKCPVNCEYTRFTLILAQFRHLHTHMGMLMGFTVADTGRWPRVLGLESRIPTAAYDIYV